MDKNKARTWARGYCAEAVPVIVRGVLYPSQSAAARALDIPQSTIFALLERGNLDGAGLGRNHDRKEPITADGTPHNSIAEAARANGHSVNSVRALRRSAIKSGRNFIIHKGVRYEWECLSKR